MRSLYSAEYIESGCTIQYDAQYAVDNTLWTYVSGYTVALMALLSGLLICYADKRQSMLMTSYFYLIGFAYLTGGASAQFSDTTNDWQYRVLRPITLVLALLGTACLMRSGLLYYFFSGSLFANIIWFSTNVTMMIVSLVLKSYLIGSIWQVVIYASMAIVYFRQSGAELKVGREWLSLKILAMLITVFGFMTQYILEKPCGVGGYQGCFANCPLSDPTAFNNAAIKNILVAAGVLFLAIAEIFLPSHDFWETEFDEEETYDPQFEGEESQPSGVAPSFSAEDSLNP